MKIIPCTDATFLVSKRQESALTMRERFDLVIHLFLCKSCRRFFEQTRLLVRALKDLTSDERLSQAEKRKLQEAIRLR